MSVTGFNRRRRLEAAKQATPEKDTKDKQRADIAVKPPKKRRK